MNLPPPPPQKKIQRKKILSMTKAFEGSIASRFDREKN